MLLRYSASVNGIVLTLYQMATNNHVHACVPVGVALNVTSYNDISLYELNGRLVEARTVFVVSLHWKLNLSNICGLLCVLFSVSHCFGHNDQCAKTNPCSLLPM